MIKDTLSLWIWLALLGSLGVGARYFVSLSLSRSFPQFPYGTLLVNLMGCLIIGLLYSAEDKLGWMSSEVRVAVTVGFLGALTTFSSFTLDTLKLVEKGAWGMAAIYWGGTNFVGMTLCLIGVALGKWLWR